MLRQYSSHSKKSLSIDCFISTSRSPRKFFQSIVTSVSLALIGFSFNRLLRQYQSHTLRNFFQSIVSSLSLALIGVSFNRLLRQYQSRTLRNFFQSLVIEWLRQYLSDSQVSGDMTSGEMAFGRLDRKLTLRYVFQSIVTSLSLAL